MNNTPNSSSIPGKIMDTIRQIAEVSGSSISGVLRLALEESRNQRSDAALLDRLEQHLAAAQRRNGKGTGSSLSEADQSKAKEMLAQSTWEWADKLTGLMRDLSAEISPAAALDSQSAVAGQPFAERSRNVLQRIVEVLISGKEELDSTESFWVAVGKPEVPIASPEAASDEAANEWRAWAKAIVLRARQCGKPQMKAEAGGTYSEAMARLAKSGAAGEALANLIGGMAQGLRVRGAGVGATPLRVGRVLGGEAPQTSNGKGKDEQPGEESPEQGFQPGFLRQRVVGSPTPDFEPGFLKAKTVKMVQFCNDVRTVHTLGRGEVEFAVVGKPVIWVVAEDGTKVAIPLDNLGVVLEGLERAASYLQG